MEKILRQYKEEVSEELRSILAYWMKHTPDAVHGGFYGRVDENNQPDAAAPKGAVLNSRILWTFSAAYIYKNEPEWLEVATRAYDYLVSHFIDDTYGGVYWTVTPRGEPLDTKKQGYAIAFALYGLSEYYKVKPSATTLEYCIGLFQSLERHTYDQKAGGYFEAFDREWHLLTDLRLSEKDANEKKSMNTHLHILEAYTNLYKIWPDRLLRGRIVELIVHFLHHIIDNHSGHLILFFDEDWNAQSSTISFGHDIEAAWLLPEAAAAIEHHELMNTLRPVCLKMAKAAAEGLDKDGGLWYEWEPEKKQLIKEKHWWPQAEAMIGWLHAWQESTDQAYLYWSVESWLFIKTYLKTKEGEWVWGVDADHRVMQRQDKAGLWKCPYHNGRACLEIIKRISILEKDSWKIATNKSL